MESNSIKYWAEEDRPREKMEAQGCAALTDSELLAIILGSGTRSESAIDLAKKVLQTSHYNLYTLAKASLQDLVQIKGIGKAKAISIMATMELGRRQAVAEVEKVQSITSSRDFYQRMFPKIGALDHEEFWAVYLNRKNDVIAERRISVGGVSNTVVDPRIIARHAVSLLASGVILTHNHPSGNRTPSREDTQVTLRVKETLKLFDCALLDHIIICGREYYSYCDEGLL